MGERDFKYPCIVDPRLDCSADYGVFKIALRHILTEAAQERKSPEEIVSEIRSLPEEEQKEIRDRMIERLILSGLLHVCKQARNGNI